MGAAGLAGCPQTGACEYEQGVGACPQVCRAAAGCVPGAGVTCEDAQGAAAAQGCGKILEHGGEPDRSMCPCTRMQQEDFSTEGCAEKEPLAADVGKGPFLLFGTTTQGGAARWLPPHNVPRAKGEPMLCSALSAPASATTKSRWPPARCLLCPALGMCLHQTGISKRSLHVMSRRYSKGKHTVRGNGPTKAPRVCSSSHPLIPHTASV